MTKFQQIPGESKKQFFDRIDHEATVEVAEYDSSTDKEEEVEGGGSHSGT